LNDHCAPNCSDDYLYDCPTDEPWYPEYEG
jgi:hypothetical protein